MNKTIAIYDDEEEYVEALSNYINKNKSLGFIALAFSNMEVLRNYLKDERVEYILCIKGSIYDETLSNIPRNKRIALLEKEEIEDEYPWVYKYQSAKSIVNELRLIIYDRGEDIAENNIHVIFSTKSIIEKEEYIELLKDELRSQGSLLYIDFSQFKYVQNEIYSKERGMSELIYYLKQGGDGIKWKFKSLIYKDGNFGQIFPVSQAIDICELDKNDIINLIDILKNMKEYDNILINIGIYNFASMELLRVGKRIELITTSRRGDRESTEELIKQLKFMGFLDVDRRFQIVEIGTDDWK